MREFKDASREIKREIEKEGQESKKLEDNSSDYLGGAHLRGRMPWGEAGTFTAFAGRRWNGAAFRSTRLTDEFDWKQFGEEHPDALPLFALSERGLTPIEPGKEPPPGTRVVHQER